MRFWYLFIFWFEMPSPKRSQRASLIFAFLARLRFSLILDSAAKCFMYLWCCHWVNISRWYIYIFPLPHILTASRQWMLLTSRHSALFCIDWLRSYLWQSRFYAIGDMLAWYLQQRLVQPLASHGPCKRASPAAVSWMIRGFKALHAVSRVLGSI